MLYIGSRLESVTYITGVSNVTSWLSGFTLFASYQQLLSGYTLGSYASGNNYPRRVTTWATGTITYGIVVNDTLNIINFYTETTNASNTSYY